MARAFNVASRRISAERVKRKLDNRFVGAETEYTAAGFGSGGVYINGRVYQSNDVGVGVVKNVGRPAAAFYASAEGGGGSSSSGGGSSSSGGAVNGDYLLRSGILPMLGNLDMGNRAITNVSLVDGRDVAVDGAVLDSIKGASLLALAVNDALTSERALVLSNAFSVTDGGAGNNYSVALATPGTLSATSENNAAGSHSHAVTASDNPGAAVSLLKTAADGNLTLTQLTTPLITTATNIDLVINPAGTGAVQFHNDQKLRTSSFDSSFPINGWQINEVEGITGYSSLTIGKIQADELAVRVFVADEVRVDRGDEYWTKSYGIVAETFTSPSAIDGTVSVMFEDSPALAGAIFSNNDWVLFRKLEIDTGISLFNLWGQVSSYVDNGDGTQNWTFTLKVGPTSEEILKGSLAIDFGASGAALIHLSVIDSAGAPYIKMRKWVTNPYTPANYTTYIQLGNLGSIGNAYYTPSGYGFYIRSTANEDQFMVADDNGFQIRGASFSLYNGSDQTVLMDNASGINLDEDVWGSWDNRRALQWWPDVSSMSGDPSLSIYTGKAVGGFTDQQNFSYIDAKPTGGVLAGLNITAFGQGTGTDALLYLEGGSQSLATASSVTVTADQIDLVGTTTMDTGRADQFNPTSDLGGNLGTTLLRWNILYVDQIIVSGAISGDTISGQEWEYPGSMVIDANSASNTTVTITNQGTGTASLDVEGDITLAGTVDGVDIALFKSGYDTHVANANGHHNQIHTLATTVGLGSDHSVSGLTTGLVLRATGTSTAAFTQLQHSELGGLTTGDPHTQYLLRSGGTLTGNVTVNTGVTIDGVDLSVHAADINAHHAMLHDITSASQHSITSATLGLVGATATNTIGVITPSANPGVAPAILRSDNSGVLTLVQLNATTKLQTPTIDTASGNLALTSATGSVTVTSQLGIGIAPTRQLQVYHATEAAALFTTDGTGATSSDGLYVGYSSQAWLWNYENTALTLATNNTARLTIAGDGNITVTGVSVGSNDYASQVTGWRITPAGGADFRYVYTDEMHAKAFIADLEQALAGSQVIAKSVTTLAADFRVPYFGGAQELIVDDLPSATGMQVFEAGDYVALRTFSRSAGELIVGYAWGVVTNPTDNGNGTQTWKFTRAGTQTYPTTITQRGSATNASTSSGTNVAPSKPSGVTSGDVVVALVVYDGSSDTVTASGWTLLGEDHGTDINGHLYYRVAGGSEPGSYTFSTGSSHALAATVVAYYNVNTTYAAIDDFSIQANAAGNSMSAPSVWSSSTQGRLVFFGGVSNNTSSTPPSGMTELIDAGSTGIRVYAAHVATSTAGEQGTKTATISSSSYTSIGASISLRPHTTQVYDGNGGGIAPGTIIEADAVIVDYGMSGNGYYEVNAADGVNAENSPYAQTVTWSGVNGPGAAGNRVVRTRTGNLYGVFGVSNEYGFYAGNGTTSSNAYVRLSSYTSDFANIPISMYSGGVKIVEVSTTRGIDMAIDTDADDGERAISFRSGETTYSHLKGYTVGNIHYALLQANHIAGLDSGVQIRASAITGKQGVVSLSTFGELSLLSNYINLTHPNTGALTDATIELVSTGNIILDAINVVSETKLTVNDMVSAGNILNDYTPTTVNWSSSGSTLLLNALNYSTIGFHDSGSRVDFIRAGGGVITLGYNGGFGAARVDFGGVIGEAWNGLSFGSGWANYGSGWNNGQVKKVGDLVFLRGLVYRFSGSSVTIATLPAGYRPPAGAIFAVDTSSGHGRVDVDSSGNINLAYGGAGYVSLNGIVFSTA